MRGGAGEAMSESDTRMRLILAAERLFADSGIEGVSLRQVNVTAGQKNASATHYHFGSKDALIEAVLLHRLEGIDARRMELLDKVEAEGRSGVLRALIEALILPYAELLDGREGGSHYIRFLAQIYSETRVELAEMTRGKHDEGARRAFALMAKLLPGVPLQISQVRFFITSSNVVHSIAEREHYVRHSSYQPSELETELFVSQLVDEITGAIEIPPSQKTLSLLTQVIEEAKAKSTNASPTVVDPASSETGDRQL
jgi:AcrR family transcriptional regulator